MSVVVLAMVAFRCPGADLQLVSALPDANSIPAGGNGDSFLSAITPDGRYVLFASAANNLLLTNSSGSVPNTSLHFLNVYLRDRLNGATTLVSANPQGNGGNGNSFPTGVSTNGQYAVFESLASDLAPGDTNNAYDVFVRDVVNGTTTLVSARADGASGNGNSRNSSITPDGRYVTFVSDATNLVAGDTNRIFDVFVRDLQAGTTTLASVGAVSNTSPTGVTGSGSPSITPDGRYVVFDSTATGLIPGLPAGEVYVRDLTGGITLWASTNARSIFQGVYGTSNMISGHADISADGQFVVFEACTTNQAVFNGAGSMLRFNLQTGVTDIISTNANSPLTSPLENVNNFSSSPDGRFVAYIANSSGASNNTVVYRWDAQAGTNVLISADRTTGLPVTGNCDAPVMTPDGRYVAFISNATNLTANALDASTNTLSDCYHLYVRDTLAGTTQLIDADTNGVGIKVDTQSVPALADDGSAIFFDRVDGALIANDWNHDSDVFARNTTNGVVELVSIHHPALSSLVPAGINQLFSTSVSTNGRYVAFATDAGGLSPVDTNGLRDIFVRDLLAGTTTLVSVATNGFTTTNSCGEPSISGDGRFVAFSSLGRMAPVRYTTASQNIFVRDLQAGTTALITSNYLAIPITPGISDSSSPIISVDGQYLLFHSKASQLSQDVSSGTADNLYIHVPPGTNYALTALASSTTGASGIVTAAMTPDGRYVAFVGMIQGSGINNLYVWDSQALGRIYTNTTSGVANVAISPNGRWVVYFVGGGSPSLNAVDMMARTNVVLCTGLLPSRPGLQFTADGRFFVFSTANAIAAEDTNGNNDVYLHDFQTGTNLLVSKNFSSGNSGNGSSDVPMISPDGRYIAYRSTASNIVPVDTNSAGDLFLFDRSNSATILISVNQSGSATANNWSVLPAFGGNSTLVFQSYASDLAPSFNEYSAIYELNLSAPAITDSDSDGMDDNWETNYFGTLARDGTGDFDGDGASDLFEYLTGTDPTDPNSSFRAAITGVVAAGQNPTINWPLAPGRSYRVQYKNDLSDSTWQDLGGVMTQVGSQGRITDLTPATGQRFYRIILTN